MVKRYKRAAQIDSATKNTVFKTTVTINYLPGGKTAWYRNLLQDSVQQYIFVDIAKAKNNPSFSPKNWQPPCSK
ncbi:hypothetical protein [Paraflavitalea speifideaquila]|uniref:hypothetical protein n=1 Tax=Paraflavitalea speifideaquila TaxID=3076558 RepID=UPI0028E4852C|nr:hypothetical protein [Paraflavitalea speifideiaquila]